MSRAIVAGQPVAICPALPALPSAAIVPPEPVTVADVCPPLDWPALACAEPPNAPEPPVGQYRLVDERLHLPSVHDAMVSVHVPG